MKTRTIYTACIFFIALAAFTHIRPSAPTGWRIECAVQSDSISVVWTDSIVWTDDRVTRVAKRDALGFFDWQEATDAVHVCAEANYDGISLVLTQKEDGTFAPY